MDMQKGDTVVHVRLSKHNLLALLTKLDHPESERTINRYTNDGVLIVTAESDEIHYKDRTPGLMVDWTEKEIIEMQPCHFCGRYSNDLVPYAISVDGTLVLYGHQPEIDAHEAEIQELINGS